MEILTTKKVGLYNWKLTLVLSIFLFIHNLSFSRPIATITSPLPGTLYYGGQSFNFTGTGTDSIGGPLSIDNFEWSVWFHHESHWHDQPPFLIGKDKGSIYIPQNGEVTSNVFYRLYLVVYDDKGNSDTAFVDLHPKTAILTINTVPQGLKVNYFASTLTTPYSYSTVQNIGWHISVDSLQTLASDNKQYVFDHWEDNSKTSYLNFLMPQKDTSVTAYYKVVTGINQEDINMLNIFPNPAIDNITIQYNFQKNKISAFLYDINSKEQRKYIDIVPQGNSFQLDLSNMKSGIYFLKLLSDQESIIKKIIIN